MFFISDAKGNDIFIKDSKDGVVERYSFNDVLNIIESGIKVYGICDNADGSLSVLPLSGNNDIEIVATKLKQVREEWYAKYIKEKNDYMFDAQFEEMSLAYLPRGFKLTTFGEAQDSCGDWHRSTVSFLHLWNGLFETVSADKTHTGVYGYKETAHDLFIEYYCRNLSFKVELM